MFNLAVVQIKTEYEVEKNKQKIINYINEINTKAQIVVFPENSMALMQHNHQKIAQSLDDDFVKSILQASAKHNQIVIFGTLEKKEGKVYNTIVVGENAKIIHKYSKTHLYDAFSYQESNDITSSNNPLCAFDTKYGRFALMVCYELRFPEIARTLALDGAQMIFVPTAWFDGKFKDEHFMLLTKTRALENTVYLCASNQTQNHYTGRSVVIDPLGIEIAKLGVDEGYSITSIDLNKIQEIRKTLPCLHQRNTNVYKYLI